MSVDIRNAIYTPHERAILDEFFDVPREERSAEPNWEVSLEHLGFSSRWLEFYHPAAAAVASIALRSSQSRLPNWVEFYASGAFVTARADQPVIAAEEAAISLLPQYLFTINWATSGPGFCWPMQYMLTWMPGYAYVVTASADSPEGNHGFCDLALGSLAKSSNTHAAIATIIEADWASQYAKWQQDCWEFIDGCGSFTADEVLAIAERVWGDEIPEYLYRNAVLS